MDYDIFRDELAIKYPVYGHALWEPSPGARYHAVQVGDVGFIREGYFHRLFNVLLPADHESHRGGIPQNYEPLTLRMSPPTYSGKLPANHLRSKGVSDVSDVDGIHALGPDPQPLSFSCCGRQGAILSLPLPAQREDTAARGDFAKCIVRHIDEWFAFARECGSGISRREDIILVTGRHLARSWANVVFHERDERVSFRVQGQRNSDVEWQFTPEGAGGVALNLGPSGENLPEDQCIFIRGFRVARFSSRLLPWLRGAAEPAQLPDDDDSERDMQLTSISGDIHYQDPLHTILEYITEQAPDDCDMALIHDDNLLCINNVSLESLRPDTVMSYLRESAPKICQIQCDFSPISQDGGGDSTADRPPQKKVAKVAMLSNYTLEAPGGSITPDTTFDMIGLRPTTSSRPWPLPTLGSLFSRWSRWWPPPAFSVPSFRFTGLRWTFPPRLYDSDSDRTRRERLPDGVEEGFYEQGGVKESLREQGSVEGSLREPNGVERAPREPGDVEGSLCKGDVNGTTPKRRALLVGISYKHSPPDRDGRKWGELDGTHTDVERFRELLIQTYGYSLEDIVVLKDDTNLPEHSQPTRDNMLRGLKRLVTGAAPGDKFIFLYSGHSDQQPSMDDPDEEDGKDEVIITSDSQRIIDNELNDILVKDLPVDCTLLAILDTCHSGTLLDLPHYYCNDLYVPWLSKGERPTKTYHNRNVRAHAHDVAGSAELAFPRPTSFASVTTSQRLKDAPSGSPSRIITETDRIPSMNQHKTFAEADPQEAQGSRYSSLTPLLSPKRQHSSPVGVRCDGWCGYDLTPRATVLSLSSRPDLQRAWEGPRGSLTAVLCSFLEKNPSPSYHTLMSYVKFQLFENCRVLHKDTLVEKKKAVKGEGPEFDGELDNFQAPQLSSLAKLEMDDILRL